MSEWAVIGVLLGYTFVNPAQDAWTAMFPGGSRWSWVWTVRHLGIWLNRYYWPALVVVSMVGAWRGFWPGEWTIPTPTWRLLLVLPASWVVWQAGLVFWQWMGLRLGGQWTAMWRTTLERWFGFNLLGAQY